MNGGSVAQVFNLLYRRLSIGRVFVCASAFRSPGASVLLGACGLKTRGTADWEVGATGFMAPKARSSPVETSHEPRHRNAGFIRQLSAWVSPLPDESGVPGSRRFMVPRRAHSFGVEASHELL
jgi:hypothetical protein